MDDVQLDVLLAENPQELHRLPIGQRQVGGELIAILSEGLYTNPLDSIREYVQNSVDAKAGNISIKFSGRSITILDDGGGMDGDAVLGARRFGLSSKSIKTNVGFRGIGIYSGFALCDRLRITSQQKREKLVYVMVFDFKGMRDVLDAERGAGDEQRTSLGDLLSGHTYIKREPAAIDRSFTAVDLQGITDVHHATLSNSTRLRDYLLENLPVDFAGDFAFREKINKHLTDNVAGFHPVGIVLQYDGKGDISVVRPMVDGLQEPQFAIVRSGSKPVAYVWSSLVSGADKIDDEKVAGLAYKVKGFTIGDRQRLQAFFEDRPQLYWWYTGEVYVLDSEVVPNAARNDFETNFAKDKLEIALEDTLSDLELTAIKYQAAGVAKRRVDQYENQVHEIANQLETATATDPIEIYSDLKTKLKDLKRQKKALGEKDKNKELNSYRSRAEKLIERIPKLQELARSRLGSTSVTDQKKAAASSKKGSRKTSVAQTEDAPTSPPQSLADVFRDAAWEFDGEIGAVIRVLAKAIDDVLTPGSPQHATLLGAIRSRLETDLELPKRSRKR